MLVKRGLNAFRRVRGAMLSLPLRLFRRKTNGGLSRDLPESSYGGQRALSETNHLAARTALRSRVFAGRGKNTGRVGLQHPFVSREAQNPLDGLHRSRSSVRGVELIKQSGTRARIKPQASIRNVLDHLVRLVDAYDYGRWRSRGRRVKFRVMVQGVSDGPRFY